MFRVMVSTFIGLLILSLSVQARTITIVRHGQADHNVNKLYNSNPEHPKYRASFLTDRGQEQASYTAHKLKLQNLNDDAIAAVYVSPLPRTRQTALILAEQGLFNANKIKVDNKLIEMQMGELEGMPSTGKKQNWDHPENKFHKGEDLHQLTCRVQSFYNQMLEQHPSGNIVVVTHGSPSMQLIKLLTYQPFKLNTADSITLTMQETPLALETCVHHMG